MKSLSSAFSDITLVTLFYGLISSFINVSKILTNIFVGTTLMCIEQIGYKYKSSKTGLKLNIRRQRSWHPVPSLHDK